MRLGVILVLYAPQVANGWWDEGHMLIAAIAQRTLEAGGKHAELKTITEVLQQWEPDFPDYSTLVTSAVWADHIKCTEESSFCFDNGHSRPNFDGLEIFNSFHSIDIPYRVDSSTEFPQDFRSIRQPGRAYTVLTQILQSLIHTTNLQHVNTTIAGRGTTFSLNMMIRLFVHIFGDVHQPLHVLSLYHEECFKSGDRGGNLVQVKVGEQSVNLHALWDSAGLVFDRSYPEVTEDDALRSADLIIQEFSPPTSLPDIEHMLNESYGLGNLAYSEIVPQLLLRPCPRVYELTPEHLELVKQASKQQIALAGYRLAQFLYVIGQKLKHSPVLENHNVMSLRTSLAFTWAVLSTSGLVVVLMTWKPWAASRRSIRPTDYATKSCNFPVEYERSSTGATHSAFGSVYCSLEDAH